MEPPRAPHAHPPPPPSTGNYPRYSQALPSSRPATAVSTASAGTMTREHAARRVAPYTTVGQFSLAPTTQTTVITTTTTTTTSFPQLVMRPPRHLNELDPKEFPLAAVPTPSNLKRFCFDIDGRPTYFREDDDAEKSIQELDYLVNGLNRNDGFIEEVVKGEERYQAPEWAFKSPPATSGGLPALNTTIASGRKRPASPVSISEAAERVASLQGKGQKRRHMGRTRPGSLNKPATPSPRKHTTRSSRNATPVIAGQESQQTVTHAPQPIRPVHQQLSQLQSSTPLVSPALPRNDSFHGTQQETPLTLSPQFVPQSPSFRSPRANSDGSDDVQMDGTATPREEADADAVPAEPSAQLPIPTPDDSQIPDRDGSDPSSTSTQPLSLPSPSLSPVTAALQHGSQGYFGTLPSEDIASPLELPPSQDAPEPMQDIQVSRRPSSRPATADDPASSGLMGIPGMLDSFDAMPAAVKTYVMYQLLRRCSKTTLQSVAEVVNPALKCDFVTLLPPELSLQVMKYLDVKSLCRAAQVSKRWRSIVDSDEWTWKKLFDQDGYQLQEGELDRAVREGWGYQDPKGDDDCERDINSATVNAKASGYPPLTGTGRYWKKGSKSSTGTKVTTRFQSKKQQKKRAEVETLGKEDFNEVISEIVSNHAGPSSAADAAERAFAKGACGLPSLRNLHLFKSIYRRHHIIRRSWIRPEVKPRHISFRGHQRHVVTCLQFDTDKILTGSDDTNINVYDTKTGALRSTLEGHDGGVWALQYEGNTLVSGSTDRTVRVWDIAAGECTQIFHGHTSTVRCLQILMPTKIGTTSDGKDIMRPRIPLIITGSRDSSLRMWRLPMPGDAKYLPGSMDNDAFQDPSNNPYFIRSLSGHQHSVRAISAHGDTLVSGSYDYSVKVWKISTGENIHTLRGHTQKVYSVVLDHKRNRCISGSMDNLVKVWSLDTGSVLYTLEGHTQLVGLLDLSPDRLVSAAADSTLRIWDPETGQCKHTLTAHTGAITCFQHDGHKVISGSDKTLKMWNVQTGEFIRDLLTDLTGVWQVKFNERRCVAAVQRDSQTYIEVLDFGAARDGVPEEQRGRRIVVDLKGREIVDGNDAMEEEDFETVE